MFLILADEDKLKYAQEISQNFEVWYDMWIVLEVTVINI